MTLRAADGRIADLPLETPDFSWSPQAFVDHHGKSGRFQRAA
jgi:hypothetical protein